MNTASSNFSLLAAATATNALILTTGIILRLVVGVESLLLLSSLLPTNVLSLQLHTQTSHKPNHLLINPCYQQKLPGQIEQLSWQQRRRVLSRNYDHSSIRVCIYSRSKNWSNNNKSDDDDEKNDDIDQRSSLSSEVLSFEIIGLICQPVVWTSFYSVATTGGGLPAGPGGSIGAVEGFSYLIVVVFALFPSLLSSFVSGAATTVTTISRLTMAIGFFILIGLIIDRGCVPNAKPILDYSAYLPVCDPT